MNLTSVRLLPTLVLTLALLGLWVPAHAAKRPFVHQTPPDLTAGGKPDDTRDWRLGPLGANGWVFNRQTRKGASLEARQILITRVDEDGPSNGKLQVDDVILGIGAVDFQSDARKALADAINEAEKHENHGLLQLKVWRDGKIIPVTIKLRTLGGFSQTAPYNCPKTDRIIDEAVEHIRKHQQQLLKPDWLGHINGLGLLATGREDVMPLVTKLAKETSLKPGETLSVDKHVPMVSWDWAYRTVFLCEYYLATGDESVLPSIRELATKIAMGQSGAGTWGHTYAARENTGELHGHLGGYGALNQIGMTMQMALRMAQLCGIDNEVISASIQRGDAFFRYFIDKGTIPYGDHGANGEWFDDNGKSAQAAVYFDLMGNDQGREFFADMVLGSAPNGREEGHTGHYWSRLWGGVAAARGGEQAMQVFYDELNPLYTLERQPDGRFAFQDNAGERGDKADPKTKWDSTGARLLTLCVPRQAIYLTGKNTNTNSHLSPQRIDEIIRAGRLFGDKDARTQLTEQEIFEMLEDLLPPIRAIAANTLAERNLNRVDRLMTMLDSNNRFARYGAVEGLEKAGFGDQQAADKLIAQMKNSDDLLFKIYAIAALINRDKQRGLLTAAKPAIPVLLDMALVHNPTDPRRVLQHDIGRALFYNGTAQPRRGLLPEYGLEGVDREKLYAALREILVNENGWARSTSAWVYDQLSQEELRVIMPDIYQATKDIAPSGIMFASEVRTKGLKKLAENRIDEGLDLAAWYIRYQKGHGNRSRIPVALEAILAYGPHARRVIPQLESHAQWYESQRRGGRVADNDPAVQIREAIEKIKAMPDQPTFELVSLAAFSKPAKTN